jgi:hypothetical protein
MRVTVTNNKVTATEEETFSLTPEQQQAEAFRALKEVGEVLVTNLIQQRVDTYNAAHGLVFESAHSCSNYRDIAGYTHRQFCDDIWLWNVAVWEAARAIMYAVVIGARTAPSEAELLAELPAYEGVE